jgi:hypothetical protein
MQQNSSGPYSAALGPTRQAVLTFAGAHLRKRRRASVERPTLILFKEYLKWHDAARSAARV